jgi:predicted GIY-YIG superfamily endonuclease
MGAIYLLHFSPSYKHAGHYLGYAEDVAPRVNAHLHGKGARLTQVAKAAGSTLILVRVWEGRTRTDERKMKQRSHVPELCPICSGAAVQMPLLPGCPAYVPTGDVDDLLDA